MRRSLMYVATICFLVLLSLTQCTQAQTEEKSCACWDNFDINNVCQATVDGREVHNGATWLRRRMSMNFNVSYDWVTCCQNGVYVAITVDEEEIGTMDARCLSGCCRWYDTYVSMDEIYLKPGKLSIRVEFDRNFCPGERVYYPIRDVVIPGSHNKEIALIVGLSVVVMLLVGGIIACVILCKARRQRKASQSETEKSGPPPFTTGEEPGMADELPEKKEANYM